MRWEGVAGRSQRIGLVAGGEDRLFLSFSDPPAGVGGVPHAGLDDLTRKPRQVERCTASLPGGNPPPAVDDLHLSIGAYREGPDMQGWDQRRDPETPAFCDAPHRGQKFPP